MFSRKSTRLIPITILIAALLLTSCNVGTAASPTPDVNALNTAIVGTTVAQLSSQFTQTALAAPTNTATTTSTPTLLPTFPVSTGLASPTGGISGLATVSFQDTPVTGANTPVAGFTQVVLPSPAATAALGDACNNNVFEGDLTIPDGTVIDPGHNFTKVWAVRNTGTCTWDDGYSLVYIGGSTPDLDPVNFNITSAADFISPGELADFDIHLTTPCEPGEYQGHWRMRSDSGYFFGTTLSVYVKVVDDC